MNKKTTFQIGDIVEWCGVSGSVVDTDYSEEYPVRANFKEDEIDSFFTLDGRLWDWHTEPSLRLIEKKKEKKRYWQWKIKTPDGVWYRHKNYLNDKGCKTDGYHATGYDWDSLEKQKILDDYIEV